MTRLDRIRAASKGRLGPTGVKPVSLEDVAWLVETVDEMKKALKTYVDTFHVAFGEKYSPGDQSVIPRSTHDELLDALARLEEPK